jgi:type IV secretion system protein VirB10
MNNPERLEKAPDAGARRLNRMPVYIICAVLIFLGVMLLWGMSKGRNRENSAQSGDDTDRKELGHVTSDSSAFYESVSNAPLHGIIPERVVLDQEISKIIEQTKLPNEGATIVQRSSSGNAAATNVPSNGLLGKALNLDEDTQRMETRRREMELAEVERIKQRRRHMLDAAMTAPTRIAAINTPGNTEGIAASSTPAGRGGINLPDAATLAALANGQNNDPNGQKDKESFREKTRVNGYNVALKQQPLSPYELKAGSVIPAVLIGGINSDLPGGIIAQVSQDVYDSATGKHLIIPQGSKLVGEYSSRIVWGQDRVLQVWTQLNFPDGSSYNLSNMDGMSQDGSAGFTDKVNNHYLRLFGSALMVSAFSAGIQLSQPDNGNNGSYNNPSSGQTIAAAVGQQMGQVGIELMRREMQIQPTIEIRPGYIFNVFVKKDIILEPTE